MYPELTDGRGRNGLCRAEIAISAPLTDSHRRTRRRDHGRRRTAVRRRGHRDPRIDIRPRRDGAPLLRQPLAQRAVRWRDLLRGGGPGARRRHVHVGVRRCGRLRILCPAGAAASSNAAKKMVRCMERCPPDLGRDRSVLPASQRPDRRLNEPRRSAPSNAQPAGTLPTHAASWNPPRQTRPDHRRSGAKEAIRCRTSAPVFGSRKMRRSPPASTSRLCRLRIEHIQRSPGPGPAACGRRILVNFTGRSALPGVEWWAAGRLRQGRLDLGPMRRSGGGGSAVDGAHRRSRRGNHVRLAARQVGLPWQIVP